MRVLGTVFDFGQLNPYPLVPYIQTFGMRHFYGSTLQSRYNIL